LQRKRGGVRVKGKKLKAFLMPERKTATCRLVKQAGEKRRKGNTNLYQLKTARERHFHQTLLIMGGKFSPDLKKRKARGASTRKKWATLTWKKGRPKRTILLATIFSGKTNSKARGFGKFGGGGKKKKDLGTLRGNSRGTTWQKDRKEKGGG